MMPLTPRTRSRVTAALALVAAVTAVSVIAPANALNIQNTISVQAKPVAVEFSPDGTTAYVANEDSDTVSVIDVATAAVTATITVGSSPRSLAVTPSGNEVWVPNLGSASVSIIDTSDNSVETLNVGGGPFTVTFTPDGSQAWVTHYTGQDVRVFTTATRAPVTSVTVGGFPQGGAFTATGDLFYVASTNSDALYSIDTTTFALDGPFAVGQFPVDVTLSPFGDELWVVNNGTGAQATISVFDLATNAEVDTIAVGDFPMDVEFSPDGGTAYLAVDSAQTLTIIDFATLDIRGEVPIAGFPTSVAVDPTGAYIYVTDKVNYTVEDLGVVVGRYAGATRFDVAVQISQQAFPGTAPKAFVVTGLNYPDALSAGPVAGVLGGPLLLTDRDVLPANVKAELQRLNPADIIVVGGPNSVSAAVFAELQTIASTTRISGADRYEASRNVVDFGFSTASTVYITTGRNFPDALSAGAVGAGIGAPVILVDGTASSVDQATLDLLAALNPTTVKIAGGPNSVSNAIQTQLSGLYTTVRLSGATRYDASIAINRDAYTTSNRVFLATGLKFPDALAGSAWAGPLGAPLYVVPSDCVPQGVLADLDSMNVGEVTLLGGTASLTVNVEDLVGC